MMAFSWQSGTPVNCSYHSRTGRKRLSMLAVARGTFRCSRLLCALHTFAIQAKSFGVFLLVKHWHFLPAAPAPEPLHLRSILPEQKRLQEQPLPLQPLIDRLAVHR